jgi:hypothetical protein
LREGKGGSMTKTVSGVIAVFLLGLYAYAIWALVSAPDKEPTQQVGTILSLVGGLVSALVVAVLAAPKPGQRASSLFVDAGTSSEGAVTIVTWAYLFVWLGCGAVLLVWWMTTPVPAQALSAAATSWLGLAVAAAYAFLGLKQP